MNPKILINPDTCDQEGLCTQVCAEDIFVQREKKTVPVIEHPESCFFCGQCLAVCPGEAITHSGFDVNNFPAHIEEMDVAPEALLGFLRSRRSVRNYHAKRQVRRELIERIIDAARYAPTGSNVQSMQHIVLTSKPVMDRLAEICVDLFSKQVLICQDEAALAKLDPRVARRVQADLAFYETVVADYEAGKDPFFYQAPVMIVTHADLTVTPCPVEDATLAAYQMMLMAQSLGLGTCFIGNIYEFANQSAEFRDMLVIPADHDILMSFTLGYPAIRFRRLVDRNQPDVRWIS